MRLLAAFVADTNPADGFPSPRRPRPACYDGPVLAPDDGVAESVVAAKRGGRIVAVYSGKGGTGVTTICVNLASLLASKHHLNGVAADMDLQYGALVSLVTT